MLMSKHDKLWSQAVKTIAHNKCEWCNKNTVLQSHHFFGRRYKSTRYDYRNGFCLCAGCHFKAHDRPSEFVLWAISKRGNEWYEGLRTKSYKEKANVSMDIEMCEKIIAWGTK